MMVVIMMLVVMIDIISNQHFDVGLPPPLTTVLWSVGLCLDVDDQPINCYTLWWMVVYSPPPLSTYL